jgi:hypothetical protein
MQSLLEYQPKQHSPFVSSCETIYVLLLSTGLAWYRLLSEDEWPVVKPGAQGGLLTSKFELEV